MKYRWVIYTEGPPVMADFLTTFGQGPILCVDNTTGEVYYLDGETPTRTGIGPTGYQRGDHLVLSAGAAVGNLGDLGGTAFNSYFQIHSTSQTETGIQLTKWGNDTKGIQNWYGKIRGTGINDYDPLVLGDRVVTDNIQGSGIGAQTGHIGNVRWVVDKTPTNLGELGGRWSISTGTGFHSTEDPVYYGVHEAIIANCQQEVYFPGRGTALVDIPAAGTYWNAVVRIGIGTTGQAAMLFDLTGAALTTTPIPGALEVDSTGTLYMTNSAGTRAAVGGGGGGGGGLTFTTIEADLGTAKTGGKFTIAGVGMTTGKPVLIQQAVGPYTGKGTRADEAEMDQVSVSASVTSATVITAYWASPRRVTGNFKFNYAIGA